MKKISKGFLALSMVASIAMAESTTYAAIGIGSEFIEDLSNGVAFEAKLGMMFYNDFGLEAQFSKSVVCIN